jgi:hypothetical protein
MLNRYIFRKTLPYFIAMDENTGKYVVFNNWKINVAEVFAIDIEQAVRVLELTDILEGEDYDDVGGPIKKLI